MKIEGSRNTSMAEELKSTWLINKNGALNTNVDKDLELGTEDSPVAVAAVIGPQNSGKSTLCNYLFGAKFEVLADGNRRDATTKGNWVAKKALPQGSLLLIDTEGSDGAAQKDDNKFEKQTALFALAVSDIIVVNMFCTDVGRNAAASWPLLNIVFEAMMRICDQRPRTLLFVLRDKTSVQTSLGTLKQQIMDELHKMWNEMTKPQDKREAKLEDYFQIEVKGMPHFIFQEQDFKVEAQALREQIISLSRSRRERIAASGFAHYVKGIWDLIKDDKDLDLPGQRIIVSEFRCIEIAKKISKNFRENESWCNLKKSVRSKTMVNGFGETVNSLIQKCSSQYDTEAEYFDEGVRDARREQLMEELLEVVEPVHGALVEFLGHKALEKFKESINLEEEYEKNGKDFQEADLVQDHIPAFLTELDKLFADACINCANWDIDHATKQREIKENEAKVYLEKERNRLVEKKNMVAEVHDKEMVHDMYKAFCENKSWNDINKNAYSKVIVKGFGKTVNSLIQNCLSKYDREALCSDERVRNERRKQLMDDLLKVVKPIHLSLMKQMSHAGIHNLKKVNLEKGCLMMGKDLEEIDVIQEYIPGFLDELDKQFSDGCVECAEWDHSTELRQHAQDDAESYLREEKNRLAHQIKMMKLIERCNIIAQQSLEKFREDESWIGVRNDVDSGKVAKGFGRMVNSLVQNCLSKYDEEASGLDETVRLERRKKLKEEILLKVVEPTYKSLIEHGSYEQLRKFKKSIDLEQELQKKGKDYVEVVRDCIPDFLDKLDNQFEDASIEGANWDHSTKVRHKREEEAKEYLDRELNRVLEKLKKFETSIKSDNSEEAKKIWQDVAAQGVSTLLMVGVKELIRTKPWSYPTTSSTPDTSPSSTPVLHKGTPASDPKQAMSPAKTVSYYSRRSYYKRSHHISKYH